MISAFLKTIKISRYRFWSYTAGPYLIGYLLGSSTTQSLFLPLFILSFMYFLIPANIFIYSVNDYFDEDTDKFNKKKGNQEFKLKTLDKQFVFNLIALSSVLSLAFLVFTPSILSKIIFTLFIFLAFFYSAKPLRFKSKPFIDSLSNALYFLPGLIGYFQTSSQLPPVILLLGFCCWTTAMHLFSAIPDIKSDTRASLKTTAVVLGVNKSLIACVLLWAIFFISTISFFKLPILIFLIIYPIIPLFIIFSKKISPSRVYWYFPHINILIGFLIFILILLAK